MGLVAKGFSAIRCPNLQLLISFGSYRREASLRDLLALIQKHLPMTGAGAGVIVTLLVTAAKFYLRRLRATRTGDDERPKREGANGDIGATARRLLDALLPRLHLRLTKSRMLSEPSDLAAIHEHLRKLEEEMENEWEYVPLPGRTVPTGQGGRGTSPAQVLRIRQTIRLIVDPREGGDAATPQVTILNKRSRRIRNLVFELAHGSDPFVLLGDPGTGKSWTMREIARSLAIEHQKRVFPSIVIFIPLSTMPQRATIDGDLVTSVVKARLPKRLQPHFERYVKTGRLIVLFDGMDEMPRATYSDYVRALSYFGYTYASCIRTLYSCRINDFSPEFRHRQLVILPFTPRQIRQFLRTRLKAYNNIDGEYLTIDDVWRGLLSEETTLQVNNPLVLSLIARYLDTEHSWPDSRRTLFESYLHTNYARFSRTESSRRPIRGAGNVALLGFDKARLMWARIAYNVVLQNAGEYIELSEIPVPIGQEDDRVRAATEGVACGVLLVEVPGSDQIERVKFAHHRFQEFLAGWYLANEPQEDAPTDIDWEKVLDEPRWQETILNLAAGSETSSAIRTLAASISEPARFTRRIRKGALSSAISERLLADRIQLAARLIKEVGLEPKSAGELLLRPTALAIEHLFENGNPSTQVKMLIACKDIKSFDFYSVAQAALTSPVRWVRNQALVVAAEVDSVRQGLTTQFYQQLMNDILSERFIRRLPTYNSASLAAGSAALRKHIVCALLSLTISLVFSLVVVFVTYKQSTLVYRNFIAGAEASEQDFRPIALEPTDATANVSALTSDSVSSDRKEGSVSSDHKEDWSDGGSFDVPLSQGGDTSLVSSADSLVRPIFLMWGEPFVLFFLMAVILSSVLLFSVDVEIMKWNLSSL
jgi:hypothetical protein